MNRLRDANTFVVRRAAAALATIWAVDAFFLLCVVPVFLQPSIFTVFYLSSGILQLVALPILAYMSDVIQRQGDAAQLQAVTLARETHDIVRTTARDLALDLREEHQIEALLAKIEAMEERILAAIEGRR